MDGRGGARPWWPRTCKTDRQLGRRSSTRSRSTTPVPRPAVAFLPFRLSPVAYPASECALVIIHAIFSSFRCSAFDLSGTSDRSSYRLSLACTHAHPYLPLHALPKDGSGPHLHPLITPLRDVLPFPLSESILATSAHLFWL